MKMHKRHIVETSRTVGWTHCVSSTPSRPCDGHTHGGVTIVETCACGAVRKTESNGRKAKSSGWTAQQEA